MKIKIFALLVTMLFSIGSLANASDDCTPRSIDICSIADDIVADIHKHIPIKLSGNMSIVSAFSLSKTLAVVINLNYDKEYLVDIINKQNGSMEQVREAMSMNTRNYICNDNLLGSFIALGGDMSYIYKYNNGVQYMKIDINNCP